MKKLRIRKIITALIVITWVPSSFASPSGISARSSSAASRRSSIATSPSVETPSGIFARSSSIEDSISIVDIDGKNQINFNFITGSNGQELVIFEHCQDGSCKPLGLKEGYSLEKLSSDEQLRELLETWKISSAGSDEQFRELLETLEKEQLARHLMIDRRAGFAQAGFVGPVVVLVAAAMVIMGGGAALWTIAAVVVAALWLLKVSLSVVVGALVLAAGFLLILGNKPDIEGNSEEGSETLVPLPRD